MRNQGSFHMKSKVFHGSYVSCQHCLLPSPTALTSTYLRFATSAPRKVSFLIFRLCNTAMVQMAHRNRRLLMTYHEKSIDSPFAADISSGKTPQTHPKKNQRRTDVNSSPQCQTQAHFAQVSDPGPGPLGQHQIGQGVVVLLLVPPEWRWHQMLRHAELALAGELWIMVNITTILYDIIVLQMG